MKCFSFHGFSSEDMGQNWKNDDSDLIGTQWHHLLKGWLVMTRMKTVILLELFHSLVVLRVSRMSLASLVHAFTNHVHATNNSFFSQDLNALMGNFYL